MSHTNLTIFVYSLCCVLTASCATNGQQIGGKTSDAEELAIIHRYVLEHRNWRERDFKIEKQADYSGYKVYFVINKEDLRRHFENGREVFESGSGKSFAVYYDPVRRIVVKEMYFQ